MDKKVKLTPYTKALTFAKEKVTEMLAPVRAREQRKRAELEMAKIDGKLIEQEQKIQELCMTYPIDFDKLIESIDESALLERRKKQFEDIVEQMFPD